VLFLTSVGHERGHFAASLTLAVEGLDGSDDFRHLAQAIAMQNTLQAVASATDVYPSGRQTTNIAGLNTNATRRYAINMAPDPVDFWDANIANSLSFSG
jgi:hypothetical protein